MTRAEIIRQVIESKRLELNKAEQALKDVDTRRNEAYFDVIKKYFGNGELPEDVYIQASYGTSYEVKRPREGYSYDKELMTIRVQDSWATNEFTRIDTSVYSASANDTFELERLQTVGKIATIILDFQDDIIAEFNSVKESFAAERKAASDAYYEISKVVGELKETADQYEIEAVEAKLTEEGIEFSDENLPSIDVRWDWTIRSIKRVKLLGKTASGKSADLEITTAYGNSQVVEKVRMDKVSNLINAYRLA